MADSAAAAGEAGICICCVSALNAFCFLKPYGLGSSTSAPCGGPRGCCGSCLENSDDEDDFERAQRKDRERRQKKEGKRELEDSKENVQQGKANDPGIVDNQPAPASTMKPPASS